MHARLDRQLTAKNLLTGSYWFDTSSTQRPDDVNALVNQNAVRRNVATIGDNHTFNSNLFVTARIGLNRVKATSLGTEPGANPLATDMSLGSAPGLYASAINISGLTNFAGGLGGTSSGRYGYTSWQSNVDAVWTRQISTIRFGFSAERLQSNTGLTAAPNGLFRFDSLSDFLENRPRSFQIPVNAVADRTLRQTIFGVYAEAQIRWFPNLSVTAGIRYEPATVPTESHGRLANLRTLDSPQVYTGGPYFMNPTLRNLAPRVGLAWTPWARTRGPRGCWIV